MFCCSSGEGALVASIDPVIGGAACLAVGVAAYLLALLLGDKLHAWKIARHRRRQRVAHWGYE